MRVCRDRFHGVARTVRPVMTGSPWWLFGLLVGLLIGPPATAQTLATARPETVGMSSSRLERLGAAIRAEVAGRRLPGAVVAVARRGKLVYYESFGQLDRDGTPMAKDAIFQIASMTKPLTAVAALVLEEERRPA